MTLHKHLSKKRVLFIFWILWSGMYLFLVTAHIHRPIFGWETMYWRVANDIAVKGASSVSYFHHPPLHTYLIASSFKIFGVSELSARLVGILCILMMPVVIYSLTKQITEEKDHPAVALVAGAVFLTSSAVIQGALVINTADTNLFLLAASLFYLFLLMTESRSLLYRSILLGILYCVCFLSKMTTSLACLIAVPLSYSLSGDIKKGIKLSIGIFITGGVLFLIIWTTFCHYVVGMTRFHEPLTFYATESYKTLVALQSGRVMRMGLDILRITLWFSPFLLLLGILAIAGIVKKLFKHLSSNKELQLVTFIAVVFLGYLYASATSVGFPKYVIPVLPMLSCLTAKFICEKIKAVFNKRNLLISVFFLLFGAVYYFVFVGDWIYPIYLLREAQVNGNTDSVLLKLIRQQVIYFFFPVLLFLISRYLISTSLFNRIVFAILISLIASNISLNIIQRRASYSVHHAYGTEGLDELRTFLRESPSLEVSTAGYEGYMANVGQVKFKNIGGGPFRNPKTLLAFMKEKYPECLIYGLATNTVLQLKTLHDSEVEHYFNDHYKCFKIGSYNILLKRGAGKEEYQ